MSCAVACPPVLVLAFNRPGMTTKVLNAVSAARPSSIFFAVDGPRPGRPHERELVAQVRQLSGRLDWGCEVHTLFRDANLGCKAAVSEAISWFFDQVEAGIVLEDDCLPDQTFFSFAAELLDRFRNDQRVGLISGNNFQFGQNRTEYSYYFSRYNHIWGWASWRRAWHLYDHQMSNWPALRSRGWLNELFQDSIAVRYWTNIFDETHAEQNSSWAYRWTFACWSNALLTVLPNVNLVSNIGFGAGATHTLLKGRLAAMPVEAMQFPLRNPPAVERNEAGDNFTEKMLYSHARPLLQRLKRLAKWLGIRREITR